MNFALASPFMLWGLLGISIPVIIHLLSRRRSVTIDWGAMQFLDIGRRARRKLQITELLLMAGRMLILAIVALALARPLLEPKVGSAASNVMSGTSEARDTVIIFDDSDSMGRKIGGTTPREMALSWAKGFAARMRPGDSISILLAKDRVRPLTDGPSYDRDRILDALKAAPPARGSSDLPAAVAEAFRILESTKNPATEVILLTDGQRHAWRPGETARWALLHDLHKALRSRAPRLGAIAFGAGRDADGPDTSVAPIEISRGIYPPNAVIEVTTAAANSGPGPATRTAELLVDGVGVAGTSRIVGPIPPGGKVPLAFKTTIAAPGAHVLAVRLSGADDALAANDLAERPVEVAEALPVVLVDGEPGIEPLGGETDFLRAALAPGDDDAPSVRARVMKPTELSADTLKSARVVVLANVERLSPDQVAALTDFVGSGGGLLVAPGDRVDPTFYDQTMFAGGAGLLPAKLDQTKGEFARKAVVAHPAPRTFSGPALGPLGVGESAPLGEADLFAYRVLAPATGENPASTLARLDTGDSWAVERKFRKGRVVVLAGPLDAEGGTLPVNPDFVPLVHELIYRLADPSASAHPSPPGQSIRIDLTEAPKEGATSARVTRPDGTAATAPIVRDGARSHLRLEDTSEPGVYRIALPGPSGGVVFASVAADLREADSEPLAPAEAAKLVEGWPMDLEHDPEQLNARLLAAAGQGPRPIWRWLVLAALGGLCLEVWMTRSLVKGRGMAAAEGPNS